MRIAQAAASAKPEYKNNIEALKLVQPPNIAPGQISVKLGAHWVPASDVNQFVKKLLRADSWRSGDSYFEYNRVTGEWTYGNDKLKGDADSSALNSEYGTERMPASEIIERILNGKMVEVTDKAEGRAAKKYESVIHRKLLPRRKRPVSLIRRFRTGYGKTRTGQNDFPSITTIPSTIFVRGLLTALIWNCPAWPWTGRRKSTVIKKMLSGELSRTGPLYWRMRLDLVRPP